MEFDTSLADGDIKLRELILYIAQKSEGDKPFGAVKLNKLLFYADFVAYLHLGSSITGQEYQKLEHGPAPRRILPVMSTMKDCGEIAVREIEYYTRRQRRPFALREADLSMFTGEEIKLVDGVLQQFRGMNAKAISEKSHRFPGWELAEVGETIPYEVALVGRRQATSRDLAWANSLVESARECHSRDAEAGL